MLVELLAGVLVLAVAVAAIDQWLLDSPLFELGTASWFPTGGDLPVVEGIVRSALAGAVPLVATVAAASLVLTAPFEVWVPGVVVVLAVTVTLSPLLSVYRYEVREPTPDEREALATVPDLGCEVVVVAGAREGPVNGYAIGGPFRDVVGISEAALAHLTGRQVAALLAHEACHHREYHVLVRGGVSVVILGAGAVVVTALFDALVPPATLALVVTFGVERVVAYWMMRRLEYRADAAAVGATSLAAVRSLLSTLDGAAGVDQAAVPWYERVFSTHPPYAARLARLDDPSRES